MKVRYSVDTAPTFWSVFHVDGDGIGWRCFFATEQGARDYANECYKQGDPTVGLYHGVDEIKTVARGRAAD